MVPDSGFVITQKILKIFDLKIQFPETNDCHGNIYQPMLAKMFEIRFFLEISTLKQMSQKYVLWFWFDMKQNILKIKRKYEISMKTITMATTFGGISSKLQETDLS